MAFPSQNTHHEVNVTVLIPEILHQLLKAILLPTDLQARAETISMSDPEVLEKVPIGTKQGNWFLNTAMKLLKGAAIPKAAPSAPSFSTTQSWTRVP